jgi:pimeloyl-ACP methyl ester carboxylesterase
LIDWYDWAGGREAMLRFGPATAPVVIVALPLFEEANRTRTFAVALMRLLADRGIASALPDLPGTGESLVQVEDTTLTAMREAMAAAVDHLGTRRAYACGIRSGALLDVTAFVHARWHLAPVEGEALTTELLRIAGKPAPAEGPLLAGGNLLTSAMIADLKVATTDAEPGPLRIVRLESDPRSADLKPPGAPLWRRAEPDHDPALAALLADDITTWIRACEG